MRHAFVRAAMTALLVCACGATSRADIIQTLDDIPTYVGSGSNRAGLVIDWGDGRDPVAWGYRWNGSSTAEDLVRAVDTADMRLAASLSEFPGFGAYIDSFGYDRNGNGFSPGDPSDSFGQGDFVNFWEFFTASASPYDGSASWISSDNGISGTTLADGNWVGFRFDADFPGPVPGAVPLPASVPEPATWLLLGGTFLGAGVVGRIRRSSRAK